jgi:transketolase
MRSAFINTLEKIAQKDKNIFLITADLGFKLFDNFKAKFPERFINVGVAEANMIGVACGLSLSGKNVYCYSMATFLTARCLEQIRVDLCYHNLNVKLIGVGGGLVYGAEGITHHALEDISLMRALTNMTVFAPGDPLEVEAVLKESIKYKSPLYVRLGKDKDPIVHKCMPDFKIGKGIVINQGEDLTLIATGTMLYSAKIVCEKLKDEGLRPTLISMPTIKPLDTALIENCAKKSKAIFTIEEHNIIGGLGSAVAESLMEAGFSGLFRKIAIADKYKSYIGKVEYLRQRHGLTPKAITKYILEAYADIRRKR